VVLQAKVLESGGVKKLLQSQIESAGAKPLSQRNLGWLGSRSAKFSAANARSPNALSNY